MKTIMHSGNPERRKRAKKQPDFYEPGSIRFSVLNLQAVQNVSRTVPTALRPNRQVKHPLQRHKSQIGDRVMIVAS